MVSTVMLVSSTRATSRAGVYHSISFLGWGMEEGTGNYLHVEEFMSVYRRYESVDSEAKRLADAMASPMLAVRELCRD